MSEQVFQLAFQFIRQEPRAAARLLESSDSANVIPFLKNTPAPMVAAMLREMLPEYAATLLVGADINTAQLWMLELQTRTLSAILRRASGGQQQNLLACLTLKKKTACQLLLSFREDMVGAIVETDIITFPTDMTVAESLKRLRQRQHGEERFAFIVDSDRKLIGDISIPQLLQSSTSVLIGDIQKPCHDIISGRASIQSTLRHPVWQKRDCAPVVNRYRELIGALWFSQLRQAVTTPENANPPTSDIHHSALELIQAHGNSMRALVDIVFKTSA